MLRLKRRKFPEQNRSLFFERRAAFPSICLLRFSRFCREIWHALFALSDRKCFCRRGDEYDYRDASKRLRFQPLFGFSSSAPRPSRVHLPLPPDLNLDLNPEGITCVTSSAEAFYSRQSVKPVGGLSGERPAPLPFSPSFTKLR